MQTKTASGEPLVKKTYHNFTLWVTHTFGYYQRNGYEGSDVSLEIALEEYGLIWAKNRCTAEEDEYHFVHFVDNLPYQGDDGRMYTFRHYDSGYLTKHDFRESILGDGAWMEWDNIQSCIGWKGTCEEWIDTFPKCVEDAMNYYGCQNIFGSCYDAHPILKYGGYDEQTVRN